MKTMAVATLAVLSTQTACAFKSVAVTPDTNRETRAVLAGATLECAAQMRSLALWEALGGAALTGVGGALAASSATLTDPNTARAVAVTGGVLTVAGTVVTVLAFLHQDTGNSYEARAGRILAGESTYGVGELAACRSGSTGEAAEAAAATRMAPAAPAPPPTPSAEVPNAAPAGDAAPTVAAPQASSSTTPEERGGSPG